ncbi:Signal transduction histidine kinase [Reichenbachiella agariperforans]|uniref:histidine kinase n=1 Tax=Reichenbachiella agariperforans TaxID=156994 RepID=A0A1M6VFE2_REIAG|nr:HAMP domain-containing sensor histidine kinase [Reichenbachiella agariperforans]SHK80065.1 Signal transduction histidine kinase [Reichenbachiella agariperforans]
MKFYESLNFSALKHSYIYKFLFIAFIGTHIPLVASIAYILYSPVDQINKYLMLLLILGFTVVALIVTVILGKKLLKPVKLASMAMDQFKETLQIMPLPIHYQDEIGQLLLNINLTLNQVKQLSEEKQNYASLITHDLRSPITSIVGIAELIKESDELDEIYEFTDMISNSGNQSLTLINETMQLIKSTHFNIEVGEKKNTNAKKFIAGEIASLAGSNLLKKINFSIAIDPELSIWVQPRLFSHVAQNLLNNAIKYSHENGLVKISAIEKEEYCEISIKDQGIGFDPEKEDILFDKFTSAKRKGTQNEPTTGLGLYLTKLLIEKHQGQIKAHSEGKDKGAIFTIHIPKEKTIG